MWLIRQQPVHVRWLTGDHDHRELDGAREHVSEKHGTAALGSMALKGGRSASPAREAGTFSAGGDWFVTLPRVQERLRRR
jgi:hypothetical protein